MKIFNTPPFRLEQIEGNLFQVHRIHYGLENCPVTEYGTLRLSDEVVKGLEKKPHSGYWQRVITQLVNQYGKLYDKYKV